MGNVNAGVILLNLAHSKSHALVELWNAYFVKITDERLFERVDWFPPNGDQSLLWEAL